MPRQKWPPTRAYVEGLEKKAAKCEQFELKQTLGPFVQCLGESITLLLAQKPFEQWPEMCKTAFKHAAHQFPVPSQVYKMELPK